MDTHHYEVFRECADLIERIGASVSDVKAVAVRALIGLEVGSVNGVGRRSDLPSLGDGVISLLRLSVSISVR